MKHMITTSAIAVFLTIFAVAGAEAGARKGDGRRGKGDRVERLQQKLSLTAEQRLAVEKLEQDMKAESEPLFKKTMELKKQIKNQWKAEKPDEAKIIALHNKMFELKKQLAELRVEFRVDVIELLTPEQRAEFAKMGGPHHGKRDGKRGKKAGKGMGRSDGSGEGKAFKRGGKASKYNNFAK